MQKGALELYETERRQQKVLISNKFDRGGAAFCLLLTPLARYLIISSRMRRMSTRPRVWSRTAPRANISRDSFLGLWKIPQQIDGFDQGRPHGDQGLPQALQAIDVLFVILIVSIDQRHKRSSVDEDHL
jgi:hypothetical protein